MHKPMPPLNALRAFEAAARHLSLTRAAQELHVTAGALSHQIRGLEDLLGLKLFERRGPAVRLPPPRPPPPSLPPTRPPPPPRRPRWLRPPRRAVLLTWADWLRAAGVQGVHVSRGLRLNSADHALDAAGEGAGVLLAHDLLAYDELRTGRLVIPVARAVSTGRGYYFVCPKSRSERPQVQTFRTWVKQELAAIDWRMVR